MMGASYHAAGGTGNARSLLHATPLVRFMTRPRLAPAARASRRRPGR